MPQRGAAIQSRGMLTALRAAAIVIVATGLNDLIAGALPQYEPLYLYLVAIAIVVLLDGLLLGLATAIISLALYALLFTPRPLSFAPQVIPLASAFGTVVVAALVRAIISRLRGAEHESSTNATIIPFQPLLAEPRFADAEVLQAIDDLRGELRDREAALERTFQQAREALTARTRMAEDEGARARGQLDAQLSEIARLRAALESARNETLGRDTDLAALHAAADELRRAGEIERARADGEHALRVTAVERVTELERTLHSAHARIAELEEALHTERAGSAEVERTLQSEHARIAELEQTLEIDQARSAGLERSLHTEHARVGELEQALQAERARNASLGQALHTERTRIGELEQSLVDAAGQLPELQITLATTRADADAAKHALESERAATQRAVADLQARLAETGADRDQAAAEIATARARVTELDRALEAERSAAQQAAHEAEARVRDLERTLAATRTAHEATIADVATLRAGVTELESVVEAERVAAQRTVAAGEARAAEAEARVAELERALDAGRAAAQHIAADADARVGEVETTLAAVRTNADAATADVTALRARVTELDGALDAERAVGERTSAAAEARVAELERVIESERAATQRVTADAEARIADLVRTLEGERAAAQQTTNELEARLAETAAAAEQERELLRARVVALESAVDAEKQLRVAGEAAFDQKLSTIATHLAQDHEADLGNAVEEREEARAEARNLGMRLSALQKKVDDERQVAATLLAEMRAAAQSEIDRLRAEIAALQSVRMPAAVEPVRPRILVAHPDAELRMSARASLERAGYEIVSAADGLEALRLAIAQRPDVVIADAVMPKMDGRELCQLLKSQEKTAHIRVVLLLRPTDDPPKGDLVPDEVLRKPVPLETLKATLASLIGVASR